MSLFQRVLSIQFVSILFFSSIFAVEYNCRWKDASGVYDLSPLAAANDYFLRISEEVKSFFFKKS